MLFFFCLLSRWFILFFVCLYVLSTPPHPQLQEAKQLERERHRQHSPVTQHTETESPTLQTHINPPNRAVSQAANGSITPSTPSINVPPAPVTPTREGDGSNDRSPSAGQEGRGEQAEQEEQGPVYENPDPENGSHYCVPENEQTEADQATAAAAAAQSKTDLFYCDGFRWQFKLTIHG